MKLYTLCCLIFFSFCSYAQGNAQSGQSKAMICSACHGADGHSINPAWPNLAGQHATYLAQQLQYYKSGTQRTSPVMAPVVIHLSSEDMADLAAFYAQKSPVSVTPAQAQGTRGEELYRQGDIVLQIPACITCHGPDGRGAEQAGFPMISHQSPEYIVQQLQAFKAGTRSTDPLKIMRTICAKLSSEDMEALANYLTRL